MLYLARRVGCLALCGLVSVGTFATVRAAPDVTGVWEVQVSIRGVGDDGSPAGFTVLCQWEGRMTLTENAGVHGTGVFDLVFPPGSSTQGGELLCPTQIRETITGAVSGPPDRLDFEISPGFNLGPPAPLCFSGRISGDTIGDHDVEDGAWDFCDPPALRVADAGPLGLTDRVWNARRIPGEPQPVPLLDSRMTGLMVLLLVVAGLIRLFRVH